MAPDLALDFALVQGQLTAYRLLGPSEAPVVLLLHGLGAAGSAWAAVASNLAVDHRVVIPDLLGSGRTAKPLIEYRPQEMALHIAGLLEGLGVSALAGAVGHSQGAAVAVELCSLWRESAAHRIEKLALVDPPPPAGVPWLRPVTRLPLGARSAEIFSALLPHRQIARLWLRFLYADQSRVTEELLNDTSVTSASRGYAAATARALHSLARLDLHLEHAPSTLLLWGAEDRVFPPALAADWQRRLPDSQCAILPATGHCPHEEQPEAVAFALRRFLSTKPASEPMPTSPARGSTPPTPLGGDRRLTGHQKGVAAGVSPAILTSQAIKSGTS